MITLWKLTGEKLDKKCFRQAIAKHLSGQMKTIAIGRSKRSCGYHSNIPIETITGDSPPQLCGHPYLKTTFNNGRGFTKTLYTQSSLHVVVGSNWKEDAAL